MEGSRSGPHDRFVVDSSGWVEFLGGGPKADAFGRCLENSEAVLLPSIVVYEVYKKMLARADLGSGGTLLITRVWTPRAGARFRYFIGRFGRKSKPSGESADGGCTHLCDGSGAPGGADYVGRTLLRASGSHADLNPDCV